MSEVVRRLMESRRLRPAEAEGSLPDEPGIYALFVDEPASLPEPYAGVLRQRIGNLLYIGKARDSLRRRAYEEEMRHKRAATFFRSLGAVLGYLPEPGSLVGKANQMNYRFSSADTERIFVWIDRHLSATAVTMDAHLLDESEKTIIGATQPLLNLQNNPLKLAELELARSRCIAVARQDGRDTL